MKKYLFIIFGVVAIHNVFARSRTTLSAAVPAHDFRPGMADDSTLMNKPAPGFELRDLNGQLCTSAQLKGKIVVLNFWFIACKPCVNEMPVLNSISDRYNPEKVVFLAFTPDHQTEIAVFLKSHRFKYRVFPDAAKLTGPYNIFAYPTSMVIDPNGIVRFIQTGGPDIARNLPAAINAALKL